MPIDLKRVIDNNLSGLTVTPQSRLNITQRIQGGKPVKKKMSLGLAIALALLMLTAAALAAVLLGGKDVVEQLIAPMAQQSEGNRFTKEEVDQILTQAAELGVQLDTQSLAAIRKDDGYYKEELARLFAKAELGMQPDTWNIEDQYWYGELISQMHPVMHNYYTLPEPGELTQAQIEQTAHAHVLQETGRDFPMLDPAQYEIGRTFTAVRANPYHVKRQWWLEFRPLSADLPRFAFEMTPQGEVTRLHSTLDVIEHGTPEEKALHVFNHFAITHSNRYGSMDGLTQAHWQELKARILATGYTPQTPPSPMHRHLDYVMQQDYQPGEDALSQQQAFQKAAKAVSAKYKVPADQLLTAGESDPRKTPYALYLSAKGQSNWKVSFGRDFLAEIDAQTGKALVVDVYSPGNDFNRRYTLDSLLPEELRAYATPMPTFSPKEREANRQQTQFFPTDLEVAPEYFWKALQAIGYNADTASKIYADLDWTYGTDPRFWPILYQAMAAVRNGEAMPDAVIPGLPAPEDMQQEEALQLAIKGLREQNDGYLPPNKLEALKPVICFTYNLYQPGSRTWQIDFVDFEKPEGKEMAFISIDAITGTLTSVVFPNRDEGLQMTPLNEAGLPVTWDSPLVPEDYWAFMNARKDTAQSVRKYMADCQQQYGDHPAFWPQDAKAVRSLWFDSDLTSWNAKQLLVAGIPSSQDITREQAEEIAWKELREAGEGAYTEEDYQNARISLTFIYTSLYPSGRIWQVEFPDIRTQFETGLGLIVIDATNGEVLLADPRITHG